MGSRRVTLDIRPVDVAGGRLCIGHRPGKRSFPELRKAGVAHVVTLLAASEGAESVIRRIEDAGMVSLWLPLSGADPVEDPEKIAEITRCFAEVASLIDCGQTVFIHCSAGIHRTGMIAYALLRYLGLSSIGARELLGRMRPLTLAEVREERLQWGEQFDQQHEGAAARER
jgi:protein-tyrosine phosphatase